MTPTLTIGARVQSDGGEGKVLMIHPFPNAERTVEVLGDDGKQRRMAPRELTLILPGAAPARPR
jgi:hypothetical protein